MLSAAVYSAGTVGVSFAGVDASGAEAEDAAEESGVDASGAEEAEEEAAGEEEAAELLLPAEASWEPAAEEPDALLAGVETLPAGAEADVPPDAEPAEELELLPEQAASPAVSAAAIRRAEQRFRRCTALRLSSFILKSSFSLFTLFDRKSVHVILLPVP